MEALKIYVSEDTAIKFRKSAMKKYRYKKGALSKAAEIALQMWVDAREREEKKLSKKQE